VIVVSPILKHVVYPALANSGYLRRRVHGGQLCVLTYHGILPQGYESIDAQLDGGLVTAQNFRSQLRLLKEIYHIVMPEEVRQWAVGEGELPERAILITCDDGLRNGLTDMAPILAEEEVFCLFFVTGAPMVTHCVAMWYEELFLLLLDAPAGSYKLKQLGLEFDLSSGEQRRVAWRILLERLSSWDRRDRTRLIEGLRAQFGLAAIFSRERNDDPYFRRFSLLNVGDMQLLAAMGMSIGSHTVSHPILTKQSTELACQEIFESKGALEEAIGKPVWALAYPFGDPASVASREMQMAQQAGYECAFMNIGGGFGARLPKFALPRVHVTGNMNLSEFEAHVSGFHRAFRSRLVGEDS
jgi:peptidoglycan/xylan/chitin deacetylase (PgdA/CDA1 family)